MTIKKTYGGKRKKKKKKKARHTTLFHKKKKKKKKTRKGPSSFLFSFNPFLFLHCSSNSNNESILPRKPQNHQRLGPEDETIELKVAVTRQKDNPVMGVGITITGDNQESMIGWALRESSSGSQILWMRH